MADLAAVAFVVILLIAVALIVVGRYNKAHTLPNPSERRWVLEEHVSMSDRNSVKLMATCPGEEPLYLGQANTRDPDFTYHIEELRADAAQTLAALNSRQRSIK